jgi:hypothetical protein
VGVSALGVNTVKASYSNYGSLFVQVHAPVCPVCAGACSGDLLHLNILQNVVFGP